LFFCNTFLWIFGAKRVMETAHRTLHARLISMIGARLAIISARSVALQ
jgi:hypothetical protein